MAAKEKGKTTDERKSTGTPFTFEPKVHKITEETEEMCIDQNNAHTSSLWEKRKRSRYETNRTLCITTLPSAETEGS